MVSAHEEHGQERLALPVLVAALAAIPAMFLSVADGALGVAGRTVDVLSGLVLVAEAVILLAVAESERAWIREHRGLIALTLAVVLAVVLADPTSRSHDLLSAVSGELSTPLVVTLSVVAGLVLGVATDLLARDTGAEPDADVDAVPPPHEGGTR